MAGEPGGTSAAAFGAISQLGGQKGGVDFDPSERLGLPVRRAVRHPGEVNKSVSWSSRRSARVRPARLLVRDTVADVPARPRHPRAPVEAD